MGPGYSMSGTEPSVPPHFMSPTFETQTGGKVLNLGLCDGWEATVHFTRYIGSP